jgi:hypothetical protein
VHHDPLAARVRVGRRAQLLVGERLLGVQAVHVRKGGLGRRERHVTDGDPAAQPECRELLRGVTLDATADAVADDLGRARERALGERGAHGRALERLAGRAVQHLE